MPNEEFGIIRLLGWGFIMIARNIVTALLAGAAVAACGGGGSSSGSGGSTGGGGGPAPTPTPTPTPTFSYTKFADLSGDRSFATACVDAFNASIGTLRNGTPRPMGDTGALSFAAAGETYTITNIEGTSESFGTAELSQTTAASDLYLKPTGFGPENRLQIFRNSETGLDFEYMRTAFAVLFTQSAPPVYTNCYFGVPTDPDDVPSEATVTYTDLRFGGSVVDEAPGQSPPSTFQSIIGGSGTLTGNTQTGELTIDFNLTIRDANGVESTIGPIQGTVTTEINGDVAGYSGILNFGVVPEYTIAGGYFGPEGRETGFAFHAAIDLDADGIPERSIYGGVAAKR